MCGLVGITSAKNVSSSILNSLRRLEYRGYDSAGIATCQDQRLFHKKSIGLVRDIFSSEDMQSLIGNIGIGHVRYPTAGSSGLSEAQPFYVN